MVNLKVQPVDYDLHSQFNRDTPSWSCNPELLHKVSNEYSLIRAGKVKSISEFEKTLTELLNELKSQTNDENENIFLDELFSDIQKLTSINFKFYKRTTFRNPVRSGQKNQLHEGEYFVTEISNETLKKIQILCEGTLEILRSRAKSGKLERADLSVNSGRMIRKVVRLLNKEFKNNGTLSAVQNVSRFKPKVIGTALELSYPGSSWWHMDVIDTSRPKTMYAHVDRSVDAPKSIIYLTEVLHDNGPTSVYPKVFESIEKNEFQDLVGRCLENVGRDTKSPLFKKYQISRQALDSELFRSHFMKLPREMRFNSHFGWDVIPGSELEDYLVSNEKVILGPPGTALIFDGAGLLHRGGLIQSGERVVLQVIFGKMNPYLKAKQILRFLIRQVVGR